jgi:cell division protein FtsA
MKSRITTGIDVGTQAIRVVIAEWIEGDPFPTVLGTGIAPSSGLRHGYVLHSDEARKSIRRALQEAEKSAKMQIKSAVLSVGGISLESVTSSATIAISRAENEVTSADIDRVVALSEKELKVTPNKKVIHVIPTKFKLDGEEVLGRTIGRIGNKLEVHTLFVITQEQHLNDLISVVEDLGVEVADVIAAPVAASLVALNKKQKNAGCVLVNIGAETMSMIVFENNTPIELHVFPIGGTDITNDIALGLKMTLEDAENIKIGKQTTGFSKKKLDEIINARLHDLFDLIDSQLKKVNRSGLLPAGIIITGGSAFIANLDLSAKNSLKIPARIANADIHTISKGRLRDASWSVAYGLTMLEDTAGAPKTGGFNEIVKQVKKSFSGLLEQLMP